jgi:hypothetical protein
MPNVTCSRPAFNPLVLNNAYAVSQEVGFKFLYDTAHASAHYGHSCTGFLPATANFSNSGFVQTIKSWYSAYCTQSLIWHQKIKWWLHNKGHDMPLVIPIVQHVQHKTA